MKQVNWGIIGLGNIATHIAKALKFTTNSRLVGVASKNQTKIEKFKIVDYVGGIIIAHNVKDLNKIPEDRRGLKIDLNNLTVVSNTIDRIHEEYQFSFSLCTTNMTTVTSNKTDQKNNSANQTLKSILKLLR